MRRLTLSTYKQLDFIASILLKFTILRKATRSHLTDPCFSFETHIGYHQKLSQVAVGQK